MIYGDRRRKLLKHHGDLPENSNLSVRLKEIGAWSDHVITSIIESRPVKGTGYRWAFN